MDLQVVLEALHDASALEDGALPSDWDLYLDPFGEGPFEHGLSEGSVKATRAASRARFARALRV